MFHNTEKTETFHGNVPQVLFVARTTINGEVVAGVVFLHKIVKCFTCRLMCADTTKCAHFRIRKGIFDWKHALERLRIHEHRMERTDATNIQMSRLHLVAESL